MNDSKMSKMTACAGGEHSLICDKLGSVYSVGACGVGWNRLKNVTAELFAWRAVPFPEQVIDIKAGYYHNLAIGKSGSVYSWGCGTFVDGNNDGMIPALGQGSNCTDLGENPVRLSPLFNISAKQIDAGAYHSVVLSNAGKVLTFGAAQLGQLGREVEGTVKDASNLPIDPVPREVQGLPITDKVKSIGAGFYNTLVACKSGSLYCAGENQNQQCGASKGNNLVRMTKIMELADKEILKAIGGYCHTMVLTSEGYVHTMGCGDNGQRGDGKDDDDRPTVTQVHLPGLQKATQIAAGANHSVILGEDGKAYSFGSNEFGQCGLGNMEEAILSPTLIKLPSEAGRVVKISGGYAHTIIQDDKDQVYSFGQNVSGQLGIGISSFAIPPADVILPIRASSLKANIKVSL
jgi:alpha-tubulin suppressor-like RCC1 family protein